jgi:hypothetical protein
MTTENVSSDMGGLLDKRLHHGNRCSLLRGAGLGHKSSLAL